jgi:hypothetical protein
MGTRLGPATISPCTITMDPDAIICSMIDRLARSTAAPRPLYTQSQPSTSAPSE